MSQARVESVAKAYETALEAAKVSVQALSLAEEESVLAILDQISQDARRTHDASGQARVGVAWP